jgi:hypothetical protein
MTRLFAALHESVSGTKELLTLGSGIVGSRSAVRPRVASKGPAAQVAKTPAAAEKRLLPATGPRFRYLTVSNLPPPHSAIYFEILRRNEHRVRCPLSGVLQTTYARYVHFRLGPRADISAHFVKLTLPP